MGKWGEWGRGCGWILKLRLVRISLFAATTTVNEYYSKRVGERGGVNMEYQAQQ